MDNLPPLRDFLKEYDLRATKKFGQNFLLDLNLTAKIARCAGDLKEGTTFEIGPGPGGLTRALLAQGAKVIAFEVDERCLPVLDVVSKAYPEKLTVILQDSTKVDVTDYAPKPRKIVANLPYNVGTLLLLQWLDKIAEDPTSFERLTLMFQKEVAERIVAPEGSKTYGRLSIIAQWLCSTEKHFDLSPQAFTPPPKVTSSVISLTPRPEPLSPCSYRSLQKVTAAAFGQRRKMLQQSLKSLNVNVTDLCKLAQIDPTLRAEKLSVASFASLAQAFDQLPKIS